MTLYHTDSLGMACSQSLIMKHGNQSESCMILHSRRGTNKCYRPMVFLMPECLTHSTAYIPQIYYSYLQSILPGFNKCVDTFIDKLTLLADGVTPVPIKEHLADVALDVLSKVNVCNSFMLYRC